MARTRPRNSSTTRSTASSRRPIPTGRPRPTATIPTETYCRQWTVRTGTSTYSYDLKNRLTSEVSPGVSNTYTYDGADNLASVQDAGGTVQYGYDQDNRAVTVKEPGVANPITFSYDTDGRETCAQYPNGVVVQDHYDVPGDLLSTKAANGSGAACNPSDPNGTPSGNVFSSYLLQLLPEWNHRHRVAPDPSDQRRQPVHLQLRRAQPTDRGGGRRPLPTPLLHLRRRREPALKDQRRRDRQPLRLQRRR